jgi:hypothetical protein
MALISLQIIGNTMRWEEFCSNLNSDPVMSTAIPVIEVCALFLCSGDLIVWQNEIYL